jgi:hypothetical protein
LRVNLNGDQVAQEGDSTNGEADGGGREER